MDEPWRTRTAIEILVGASHRDIGIAAGKIDRQRAGGMRQIPDHDGAGGVCLVSDCLHVVHPAGAVIDMGQHDRGHLLGDVVSHRFRDRRP
jgi:hypothetical protein